MHRQLVRHGVQHDARLIGAKRHRAADAVDHPRTLGGEHPGADAEREEDHRQVPQEAGNHEECAGGQARGAADGQPVAFLVVIHLRPFSANGPGA